MRWALLLLLILPLVLLVSAQNFSVGIRVYNASTLTEPLNLTITLLADNQTLYVNWTPWPGGVHDLLIIDGVTGGELDFEDGLEVLNIMTNEYNDTNASATETRYYRVRVNNGTHIFYSEEVVGKNTINMSPNWNLISLPAVPDNTTVPEVLHTIDTKWSAVYWFDNDDDMYRIYINPVANTFTQMSTGNAYWINVLQNVSFINCGTVQANFSKELEGDWNLLGFPVITGSTLVPDVIASLNGSWSAVYWFDNDEDTYKIYINPVANTFTDMKEGRGYWIKVNVNDTINYTNSIFV